MAKAKKNYKMDMTSGPILSKLIIFTLPLIASSILQLLFNTADVVVVGKFCGDNELAAVGSNTALIALLTNLFLGLSIGGNVVAARYFGAKKDEELSDTIHTSMLLSIISGIVLTLIGVFGAKQILEIMQTPGDVLLLATEYLQIYFLGMTAMMIYNFGSALLRALGDTKRPFLYLFIAGIINIILNLILVIVFGLGVAGVAIATAVSQCISAILIIRCLMKEEGSAKLYLTKLRFKKTMLFEIIRIGVPAGIQGVLFSLSNTIIQSSVNSFGEISMSGNAAAANLEQYSWFVMNGFHQGCLNITSQNYGVRDLKRVKKAVLLSELCVIVFGLAVGQLEVFFGRQLLGFYTDSAEAIEIGMKRLILLPGTHFLCGMMDVMVGGLRGIGYSVMPMVVSFFGSCVLRIVWIFTVFQIPEYHTMEGLFVSYPISWILTFSIHLICFFICIKKVKERFASEDALPDSFQNLPSENS